MKYCKQCELEKKDKYFYPNNSSRCKQCISINNKNKTNEQLPEVRTKQGYVYVIINKAWKGYYKIGQTINLTKRLGTYQTASPKRDYTFLTTIKVRDMDIAERKVLEELKKYYDVQGEWVLASKPEHIIHLVESIND